MLSREGRSYMETAPWLAIWPGVFLTITVYSLNMFGDAIRDLLDPRLRGGTGRLGADAVRTVSNGARGEPRAASSTVTGSRNGSPT